MMFYSLLVNGSFMKMTILTKPDKSPDANELFASCPPLDLVTILLKSPLAAEKMPGTKIKEPCTES